MKHGQHDVPWCLVSTLSLRAVKGAQTKYKQKTMERATLSALVMAHDFVSPRFICRKRGNMNRDYCSEITQTSLFYRFRLSPTRDNTKLQFSKVDWQNSTLCRPKPPQKKNIQKHHPTGFPSAERKTMADDGIVAHLLGGPRKPWQLNLQAPSIT